MSSVFGTILLTAGLVCTTPSQSGPGSYVTKYVPGPDGVYRPQAVAYVPQPGDLVFFDDHSKFWGILYSCVRSGPPFHAGIIIRLPDGRPGILEAGPDDTMYMAVQEAIPRLQGFAGEIWIRPVRTPLTEAENQTLTEYALSKHGGRYAFCRLLLQGTVFNCHSSFRCQLFGKTDLNRSSYLCAELAVAAGTLVGRFDPSKHFANAIYPRDIVVDNQRYDISATYLEAVWWSPSPHALPPRVQPR